ncbi:hypothetical protein V525_01495 [Gordonia alkanivorans CGMCC 6845]|uniref:Protein kinase n=1 Tax=Gordonia alkanivorans CGMCC 6845 TaxID=1423140 RepID=W9DMP4_9ACTN|nr:hypothetical protein [Gordonia alkanivorans]ETA08800.1 hypothetical protein V525_01495 [Gordonia alkanivorans CGMCC 6845]
MTYPPDGSGGCPPGGYPGGYGPGGYPQGPPPPPPRSPWTSPAVLVAIGAGVLLVVAGVLAAFLLIPADEESTDTAAASSTDSEPPTITSTVTQPPPPTPTTTTTSPPPTVPNRPAPPVAGADWQGFVTGPRCNAADDPAVAIGQTSRSRVVICQVGNQTGRWYYKGQAPEGGIELQFPTRVGNTFEARNGAVRYLVSPSSLTIAEGGSVLANEPMLAYWSSLG